MKKKILTMITICTVAAMAAGCGAKDAESASMAEITPAETTAAAASGETKEEAKAPTKPDLSKVDPKEALGPGAFETEEETNANEMAAGIENKNMEDLENSDYQSFAKEVLAAVAEKNLDALAEFMNYPAFVGCAEETNGMIDDKDAFLALGAETVFTEEMVKAMEAVDMEKLEPSMAGVVLGDEIPNIIINSVDGELKIVGMNY